MSKKRKINTKTPKKNKAKETKNTETAKKHKTAQKKNKKDK